MKPSILVSAPDLRPSLRGILDVLNDAGMLARVVTTIGLEPSSWQTTLAGRVTGGGRHLANRMIPTSLSGKVTSIWSREAARVVAARFAGPSAAHRVWRWAETSFDRIVARRFAGQYRCVYGMEHSSLATFRAQKAAGGVTVLRQVTGHGRAIARTLRRAANDHPQHVDRYYGLVLDQMDEAGARKSAEIESADLIIGNSEYVYQSFLDEGVAPSRVTYVPTGCPRVSETPGRSGRGVAPLRFVFVGTLSLRKGILELLDAWRISGAGTHAELCLAGAAELDPATILQGAVGVRYLGVLSRQDTDALLQSADVFILPSLMEGLSHALLEALSTGLPIVTTRASGCGALVEDRINGFVLSDEAPGPLGEAITWCLEHRGALPAMGERSRSKAAHWTVADSNRAHLELLQRFLGEAVTHRCAAF